MSFINPFWFLAKFLLPGGMHSGKIH